MSDNYGPPPVRGEAHERLAVFVGRWRAEGESFGGPAQDPNDPRENGAKWVSDETTEWHPGRFFLVQNERARIGDQSELITHAIIGYDGHEYYAHAVENHGFYRRYTVACEGRVWTFASATERARIEFSPDGHKQDVVWEWRPRGELWLPLCERVNVRVT